LDATVLANAQTLAKPDSSLLQGERLIEINDGLCLP
jgi:hypothetical protein